MKVSGNVLKGNYIGNVQARGNIIDCLTGEHVTVNIDETDYNRAVYERIVWRNMRSNEVLAHFVWVKGKFYELN